MSLLDPPLRSVRVYSPALDEASRTKKVPSGVSFIRSLTSSRVIFPQYQSASLNGRKSSSLAVGAEESVAVWDDGRRWLRGGRVGAGANSGMISPQSQRNRINSKTRTCASALWTTCLPNFRIRIRKRLDFQRDFDDEWLEIYMMRSQGGRRIMWAKTWMMRVGGSQRPRPCCHWQSRAMWASKIRKVTLCSSGSCWTRRYSWAAHWSSRLMPVISKSNRRKWGCHFIAK